MNHSFAKTSAFCDAHLFYLIYNSSQGQQSAFAVCPIKRTTADQKRSCGYAPQIQELINSKLGIGKYQLDKEHFPLYPDFEDNEVVMNEDDPSSVQAHEKKEKARKEKAAKMPTQEEASEYFLKTNQE